MRERTSSPTKKITTSASMSSQSEGKQNAAREQRKERLRNLIEPERHAARGKSEAPLDEARKEIAGNGARADQGAHLPLKSRSVVPRTPWRESQPRPRGSSWPVRARGARQGTWRRRRARGRNACPISPWRAKGHRWRRQAKSAALRPMRNACAPQSTKESLDATGSRLRGH